MTGFQVDDTESLPRGPEVDTGVLTWLSEQWWTPWVMLVASVAVGLWMVRSLLLHRGRAHAIERAAAASGMAYREQDGFGLSRIGFHHMGRSDGRGWTATNIVTIEAAPGHKTHAFDVRTWAEYTVVEDHNGQSVRRRWASGVERATSRVVRRHQGATCSAAMARIPINAPRLVIARENLASKLFNAATRLDLDLESEAFNRAYHVIGGDRAFARSILDARMIDLMTQTEGEIGFEFFGNWLLLHTARLEPALMPGLARLADEMRGVIPPLVLDRWPSAGGGPAQPGLTATPR